MIEMKSGDFTGIFVFKQFKARDIFKPNFHCMYLKKKGWEESDLHVFVGKFTQTSTTKFLNFQKSPLSCNSWISTKPYFKIFQWS